MLPYAINNKYNSTQKSNIKKKRKPQLKKKHTTDIVSGYSNNKSVRMSSKTYNQNRCHNDDDDDDVKMKNKTSNLFKKIHNKAEIII